MYRWWLERFLARVGAITLLDDASLPRAADAYLAKYGSDWTFTVEDGAFHHHGNTALVFKVVLSTVFGFGKGELFSQTQLPVPEHLTLKASTDRACDGPVRCGAERGRFQFEGVFCEHHVPA